MRRSLILLVACCLLLLALPAFAAPPADRAQLYEGAGLADFEIERIEEAIASWMAKPGSATALSCFEEAGVGVGITACVDAARGDGDQLGLGVLLTLDGCRRIAGMDNAGAAGVFGEALTAVDGELGPDDPLRVMLHSSLGVALANHGDLEAGVQHGRTAVALAERILGVEHEYVAQNQLMVAFYLFNLGRGAEGAEACEVALRQPQAEWLDNLAGVYCFNRLGGLRFARGDYRGAEVFWRRSLPLIDGMFGAGSADGATIAGNLGNAVLEQGRFDEALALFRRAQDVVEAGWPEGSLERVGYSTWLAEAHVGLGQLEEAATIYKAVTDAWEQHHGRESSQAALGLQFLAGVRQRQGRYVEAEQLLDRAVAVTAQSSGPYSIDHGSSLAAQAELQRETGRHREAAATYARARGMFEAAYGADHPEMGGFIQNEANLRREMGDLAGAREGYEHVLAIYEAAYGPDHPHVATVLTSLAGLRLNLGDLEGARPMLERAVAVYEATVGPEHEWTATGLNNLGTVEMELGNLDRAADLITRAAEIWERTVGLSHPNTLVAWANATDLLVAQERFDQAIAFQGAWLKHAEERLGPGHPTMATAHHRAGDLLRTIGHLDEAGSHYERSLAIRSRTLGAAHPDVARTRVGLARLDQLSGRSEPAREQMALAFASVQEQVVPLLDATSERERIALIRRLRSDLDFYVTLFDRREDVAEVHRAVLAWKAVVKNSLARQRDALSAAREPELAGRIDELADVRRSLATAVFAEPADPEAHGQQIAGLVERKEALERELARSSGAWQERRRLDGTSPRDVCDALGDQEALVDLLRYQRIDVEQTEDRYLAVVQRGGACDAPVRVELGSAEAIDKAVLRYRRKVSQLDFGSRLQRQAQGLRELLWDPVEPHLGERTAVWLVPDGGLSGLPFAALVDTDGRFLVERYTIGYLASGNDLLRQAPATGVGALVVGGVDYEGGAEGEGTRVAAATTRSAPRGALEDFAFLPATVTEAAGVADRLSGLSGDTVHLEGRRATEERIRELAPGRRIVHLATHGFFATGRIRSALDTGAGDRGSAGHAAGLAMGLNPMLLSGVVLAGANSPAGDGADDGVLTAEEVVALDLRGVELVTLSACDTGLGEVERGEGVMGLRRAFALAGARSLVFSLWQVPDAETGRLMTAFYDRIAAAPEQAYGEAFRASQLQLIEELRAERGDAPPLFWAAFVVSGR